MTSQTPLADHNGPRHDLIEVPFRRSSQLFVPLISIHLINVYNSAAAPSSPIPTAIIPSLTIGVAAAAAAPLLLLVDAGAAAADEEVVAAADAMVVAAAEPAEVAAAPPWVVPPERSIVWPEPTVVPSMVVPPQRAEGARARRTATREMVRRMVAWVGVV